MRVLFIHGLESSPQGRKARYLAERFEALTPPMSTGDFPGCVRQQAEAIEAFAPDVVVGSSFGGAVVLALLEQGTWRGPTLLLAQAALKFDPAARLPEGASALVVHGVQDEVVPVEHSRRLASTGDPQRVRLVEVEDTHRLWSLLEGEELAELVREAHALGTGRVCE